MLSFSRLRLRLAAGFALAFALGLGVVAASSLGYLWSRSNRRLSGHLVRVVRDVAAAMEFELNEGPNRTLHDAALEAKAEWPLNRDLWAVLDEQGGLVASRDSANELERVLNAPPSGRVVDRFGVERPSADLRAVRRSFVLPHDSGGQLRFSVVAVASIEGIETDSEMLARVLAIGAPLILLTSLAAGYALARRALRPVDGLREAIAGIGPTDLGRRLPVREPADEIDALAEQFNALLGRLDDAQRRNRLFVREAAHQIRTPLTLVLGEAAHELSGQDTDGAGRAALSRIQRAAELMGRRVDELFLLAEADSGEPVQLDEEVELDGLVLECTDMMRARAQALGRSLALGPVAPAVVRANARLLREALLELLENGCRHGASTAPVTASVRVTGDVATIEIRSALDVAKSAAVGQGHGLGLAIVSWIAAVHGGAFEGRAQAGVEVAELSLPLLKGVAATPASPEAPARPPESHPTAT